MSWNFDQVHSEHNNDHGEMRMDLAVKPTVEQFIALPDGTEIHTIEIGFLGMSMASQGLIMNEVNRNMTREWAKESGNDHMPFQFMVYLLPDGYDITKEMHEIGEGK